MIDEKYKGMGHLPLQHQCEKYKKGDTHSYVNCTSDYVIFNIFPLIY